MWWVSRILEMPHGQVILASWCVWVISSIVLHELAHGWTAIRAGDDTPIRTGHMTWNPLVHMGGPSLIVFALVGIAWGAMPVNPARFRNRYDDALVSIAGPAMNLLLAALALGAMTLWLALGPWANLAIQEPLFTNVVIFLRLGIMLNLVLCALNMLPIPPLDGSRVLATFSAGYRRLCAHEHAQVLSLFGLIAAIFILGPHLFGQAAALTDNAIDLIVGLILGNTP
jgi:Zn-dependent protease